MGYPSPTKTQKKNALGWKNLVLLSLSLFWLFYFFQTTDFLLFAIFPIVSVFILSMWKHAPAWPLFDLVGSSFIFSLAVCALAATVYYFVFDILFLGIIASFPVLSTVPVFILIALFWAVYGFLCMRQFERRKLTFSESAFFASQLAAAMVIVGVIFAIPALGAFN